MGPPDIDYYDHPVFDPDRLRLQTPAMQQVYDTVRRWIWTGATGGVLIGHARVGKSVALEPLIEGLYTRGKIQIPTVFISCAPRDQPTVKAVFYRLCRAANLGLSDRKTADVLNDAFEHYVHDLTAAAGCSQCVLIVDEMQCLKIHQFEPFAELYNDLRKFKVSLRTIFVGNEAESLPILEELQTTEYGHIYGRFFRRHEKILGLTSEADVKACLAEYDRLRYPEGDGPTYTAFFLGETVTLASLSSAVWRVYGEYQRDYHIPSWGMEYFTNAIQVLLTDFLPECGIDAFDDEMMHECIRISGLIPSLVELVGGEH